MPKVPPLTLQELARKTGVSTARIKKLVELGHVKPARNIGTEATPRYIFYPSAVAEVENIVDVPPEYMHASDAAKFIGMPRPLFHYYVNRYAVEGITVKDRKAPYYTLEDVKHIGEKWRENQRKKKDNGE